MKNYRWFIVTMLLIATTINYIDRQVIGLLKPVLEKEFDWTETDFARIVMAFSAAYATGLLLMGRLIDRVGTKWGYAIAVIIWSLAGMMHAVVRSVSGFAAVRMILGIGEAGNFPAAMKAVSEWFPKKEKGLATGILNAGSSVGVVAALLIVPWILSSYGWQEVFWITGFFGFIWLIVWWLVYELPAKHSRVTADELAMIHEGQDLAKQPAPAIKWGALFRMPQTWAVVTGKFLIDPIYWFFLFWLPSYFASTFGLDLKKPSLPLMVIYAATTIGSVGGGYFSSWLIKKGWSVLKARKSALLIFALLEFSIILVQFMTNVWFAVALLSLAVALHQAWATNVFTLASDLFPKESVSSVVGIAGMAGAAGGILFPMLIGSILDQYKAVGNLRGGYDVIFTLCGFIYSAAWLIMNFLTKQSEPK
ncbi:Hexuronate transporter [Dyadobacter sp. CECT 9275]|uniref:Hexuronate transporter n=1 Tax=Dyadobacter helix TaxID=2822344 RepID=A0A916NDT5_9BACT|nr:MFS transporter [Dyadobacter sp. CECT 9275]CAG5012930.1 Hexuronate transporter [Dyadobacter sp. CECT 9275]